MVEEHTKEQGISKYTICRALHKFLKEIFSIGIGGNGIPSCREGTTISWTLCLSYFTYWVGCHIYILQFRVFFSGLSLYFYSYQNRSKLPIAIKFAKLNYKNNPRKFLWINIEKIEDFQYYMINVWKVPFESDNLGSGRDDILTYSYENHCL